MIIVTGGAGFIGSNLVHTLNQRGRRDILVVDNLTNGKKFQNLVNASIVDYLDKHDFLDRLKQPSLFKGNIEVVFHNGACSTTTEWDGRYMLQNNYEYSKILHKFCIERNIPFIYASSAAVYGLSQSFREDDSAATVPLNVYGYSKLLFDQYLKHHSPVTSSQVVGLRYFNVYGPRETHKGAMASVAYHLNNQLIQTDKVKLFEGCDGYANGEQRRDFIHVDDIVDMNLWFWENPQLSGIFNAGTGRSQTFNDVARSVIAWHQRGDIEYIPFPSHLKGCYQSYTQADITALRSVGYMREFLNVEQGVPDYLNWLNQ